MSRIDWQSIGRTTDHRPWPTPPRPWVMTMSWLDLAFLHWRVDVRALEAKLPPGLLVDTFEGEAWLGIVPFRMKNVGPRYLSSLPWISHFPELNVRTYVTTAEGKPGVWFFSLDATNPLAVLGARASFHLPYFHARIRCERRDDEVLYDARRTHRGTHPGVLRARYRPLEPPRVASTGSLEHWLSERYCLYASRAGKLYRADVNHHPWPLCAGAVDLEENTVAQMHGFELQRPPDLVHVVDELDVVAWAPERVPI